MKTHLDFAYCCVLASIVLMGSRGSLAAQERPWFTAVQALTNQEMLLKLSAPTGLSYRIDVSTNLQEWVPLVTLSTNRSSVVHPDSGAPFHDRRFYRALQLTGTNNLTGDHLITDEGEVVIHPIRHATFYLRWRTNNIYVDPPQNGAGLFKGLPRPDLILITHDHSDHFDAATVAAVKGTNTVIIAPSAVCQALPKSLQSVTTIMTNGATTSVLGISVAAVPAYGPYHPKGTGNGYILTLGGRRIYVAGETDVTPELLAVRDIEVAFISIVRPFLMDEAQAAAAVREIRPRIVYPCHYSDFGISGDPTAFKRLVGTDRGIEVRLRKWY